MNCRNCKHFGQGVFRHGANGPVIEPVPNMQWGVCLHPKVASEYVIDWLHREKQSEPVSDGLLASCDEGRGDIQVGPNFGCIHFEH